MESKMKTTSRKVFWRSVILALSSAALIPNVHAEGAEGFNLGVDYGATKAKKYCDHITNCSDSDNGPKFDLGYEFGPNFSAELGYTSFGTVFDAKDNVFTASQDSNAITLSGLGILPINEMFSIYARLGYARYNTNSSGTVLGVAVSDKSGNSPVWGVGAKYDLTNNFALRVEFENYSDISRVDGSKDDIQGMYVGIVFRL